MFLNFYDGDLVESDFNERHARKTINISDAFSRRLPGSEAFAASKT